MATIVDCLNELAESTLMIDLSSVISKPTPVADLKTKYANNRDDRYEVRQEPYAYGRKFRLVIGIRGGETIFRESN